jgi:hypothetical protein
VDKRNLQIFDHRFPEEKKIEKRFYVFLVGHCCTTTILPYEKSLDAKSLDARQHKIIVIANRPL